MKFALVTAFLFLTGSNLFARELFGVLGKTQIEEVGVKYLTLTQSDGGPVIEYKLAIDRIALDVDKLVGHTALVTVAPKPTPAPQGGSLYPVLSITLYPTVGTYEGSLKVIAVQGGFRAYFTVGENAYVVKLGSKSLTTIEKLGLGTHDQITVTGVIRGKEISAEAIRSVAIRPLSAVAPSSCSCYDFPSASHCSVSCKEGAEAVCKVSPVTESCRCVCE